MKVLVVLSAVLAVSLAKPGYLQAPFAGRFAAPFAAPLAYSSVVAPALLSEQHHAQDVLGQYRYGYSDGLSTKGEYRTADGVTRGAYAYVDSEGKVQNVAYTADAAGFRVSASNLPEAPAVPETVPLVAPEPVEDTAEVVAAKAAHEVAIKEAKALAAAPAPAPAVIAAAAPVAAPAVYAAAAPAAFGYPSIAAPAFGYSAIAPASGFSYSTLAAAPVLSYSALPAAAIPQAGVPVLTAAGVPVDTPEVQAAKAADYVAHLRVKGLLI